MTRWADCDVVIMTPEADFVAGLDAEFVAEFFGNDDLALGSDTASHTGKYNSDSRHRPVPTNAGCWLA